jgi:hypothetical protein
MNVRRAVRDRRVISFKICQECDCLPIHELDLLQVENDRFFTAILEEPFLLRQIFALYPTDHSKRHHIPTNRCFQSESLNRHENHVALIAQHGCQQ